MKNKDVRETLSTATNIFKRYNLGIMLQGCWAALIIIPLQSEKQMKQKDDRMQKKIDPSQKAEEDVSEVYTMANTATQSENIQNAYMIESRIFTIGEPQNTKTVIEISTKEGIESRQWTINTQPVKNPYEADTKRIDKENSTDCTETTSNTRCTCCLTFINESKIIFSDRNFQLASASMVFLVFSMSVGLTHMISYSEEEGYSKSFGNTLLTIAGIASLREYFSVILL